MGSNIRTRIMASNPAQQIIDLGSRRCAERAARDALRIICDCAALLQNILSYG
jgi:hypothetical protein